jgi:hypothetical protein
VLPGAAPDQVISVGAIVEKLTAGLRRLVLEQQVRTVALCYDGRVVRGRPRKNDAIVVGLEHVNGESVYVYVA